MHEIPRLWCEEYRVLEHLLVDFLWLHRLPNQGLLRLLNIKNFGINKNFKHIKHNSLMWDTKHRLPPSSPTIISLCSLKDGANFSLISVINTFIQGPKHHQGGLYVSCKDAHFDIILCMRVSLELKRRGMMFSWNISHPRMRLSIYRVVTSWWIPCVQYQINISYKG